MTPSLATSRFPSAGPVAPAAASARRPRPRPRVRESPARSARASNAGGVQRLLHGADRLRAHLHEVVRGLVSTQAPNSTGTAKSPSSVTSACGGGRRLDAGRGGQRGGTPTACARARSSPMPNAGQEGEAAQRVRRVVHDHALVDLGVGNAHVVALDRQEHGRPRREAHDVCPGARRSRRSRWARRAGAATGEQRGRGAVLFARIQRKARPYDEAEDAGRAEQPGRERAVAPTISSASNDADEDERGARRLPSRGARAKAVCGRDVRASPPLSLRSARRSRTGRWSRGRPRSAAGARGGRRRAPRAARARERSAEPRSRASRNLVLDERHVLDLPGERAGEVARGGGGEPRRRAAPPPRRRRRAPPPAPRRPPKVARSRRAMAASSDASMSAESRGAAGSVAGPSGVGACADAGERARPRRRARARLRVAGTAGSVVGAASTAKPG